MNSLQVVFSNPTGTPFVLERLSQLHLMQCELRETPGGPVLARDRNYRWETPGGTFSRFDCDVRCHASLARAGGQSTRYGPFRGFSSLNGLKFVDHQLFCVYDESTKDWYGYESGEHWDSITVTPA